MASKRKSYSPAQGLAMAIGVALVGLDAFGAFEAAHKSEGASITYIVLAAPIIAIAAGLLPLLSERAGRSGHYLKAAALFVAFAFAGAVVVMAALERTVSAQGRTVGDRQAINQRVALASGALTSAETALVKATAEAAEECKSGRGPKCLGLEQREEAALQRVSTARDALADAGVPVTENPLAKAMTVYLPISEATAELYAPTVLPLALLVTGFCCIWYGAPHGTPARKRTQKAKARKKPTRRKPVAERRPADIDRADNVIPFRRLAVNDN